MCIVSTRFRLIGVDGSAGVLNGAILPVTLQSSACPFYAFSEIALKWMTLTWDLKYVVIHYILRIFRSSTIGSLSYNRSFYNISVYMRLSVICVSITLAKYKVARNVFYRCTQSRLLTSSVCRVVCCVCDVSLKSPPTMMCSRCFARWWRSATYDTQPMEQRCRHVSRYDSCSWVI